METAAPANKSAQQNVYAIVNEKIIEQLNKGIVPWQKPWTTGGFPKNLITNRQYRGINVLLLAASDYEHNLFLTYQQLEKIGGRVKKGEKGHMVVYWNSGDKQKEQVEETVESTDEKKKAVLRYYYVFNISQCDKIPEDYLPKTRETADMPTCESIVKNMPKCPVIRHKEQKAFYDVVEDYVNMPKKRSFKTDAAYYSTLFHELVHSTGHHDRLDRTGVAEMAEFGDAAYSQEELVAEIGTCYLQSFAGITGEFKNSTAYIQGWLGKLKNDRRMVIAATSAAQKATDYILNQQQAKEEMSEE